jgi:hypothetical protein
LFIRITLGNSHGIRQIVYADVKPASTSQNQLFVISNFFCLMSAELIYDIVEPIPPFACWRTPDYPPAKLLDKLLFPYLSPDMNMFYIAQLPSEDPHIGG